jgi:hypothetical protein
LSFIVFGIITYIIVVKKCFNRCVRLTSTYPCPYCNSVYIASEMKTHLSTCTLHLKEFITNKDDISLKILVPSK